MRRRPRAAVEVVERRVTVAGRPVRYGVAGAGDPVVLIHGLAGSWRWWRPSIPALAEHYLVHLVDLPGFGLTRRGQRFVLGEAADWLLEWMRAIDLEAVHLVGHSMGGYIAVHLAAAAPEAVRRLVLVAPAGSEHGRTMLGYGLPLLVTVCHLAPSFLPVLARDALRSGPVTVWRAARQLLGGDLSESLQRVTVPTLLIWGAHDRLVPPVIGRGLRAAMPCARLLIIEGAGHVPMYERPREFDAAVLAFFAGQPVGE
jgi:pimeloyl-ACP methyl ester carboxylesterase